MDKLEKALAKLRYDERDAVMQLIRRVVAGRFKGLDLKKLRGYDDIYRVRNGRIRIIFRKNKGKPVLLQISRRSEKTYR